MSFRDMVERDNGAVFLNLSEFGEERDLSYDGKVYRAVPAVLTGLKENDRKRLSSGRRGEDGTQLTDRLAGFYARRVVLHVRKADIGGSVPEVGGRFKVREADSSFWRDYYVVAAVEDMGIVRVELGGLDE